MAWPLIAGAAIAAIPGLVGKAPNQRQSAGYNTRGADGGYDANAPLYGGHVGGLAGRVGGLAQASDYARDREAIQANYLNADIQRAQNMAARNQQTALAQQMTARAQGRMPSIAQMQADRQMGQAAAAQRSMAAGARGQAGLALAQQNAAGNIAAMQSGISNQAQINAAQERLAAEQAAFGAHSGMRQQDIGGQGLEANMAQYQAGLQQQNRAQNDQTALGYNQMINQAQLGEMQARTQMQGTLANAYLGKERLENDRETSNKQSQGIIGTLGDLISDINAKVPAGQSYGTPTLGTQQYLQQEQARYDNLNAAHAKADAQEKSGGDMMGQFGQGMQLGGMLSDDRAKLAAAWEQGAKAGAQTASQLAGLPANQLALAGKDPRTAPIADAVMSAKRNAYGEAQKDVLKANAPNKKGPSPDFTAAKREMEAARLRQEQDRAGIAAEAGAAPPLAQVAPVQPPGGPFAAPAPAVAMRGAMLSDFTSKEVMDLGDIDAPIRDLGEINDPQPRKALGERAYDAGQRQISAQMSDAVAEAQYQKEADKREAKNTAKTVKRDTPADQARVKRGYEDKAGREAAGLIASMRSQMPAKAAVANRDAIAPDLSAAADANRTLVGSMYAYKPGMTMSGQAPGEPNFGPMAQNLQANPISATAVKPDPRTGLLSIDRDKALKLALAGNAENQRQQDETRTWLAQMLAGRN